MADPVTDIQAVLFDADGVVQTTSPGWLKSLSQLSGSPDSVEQFLADVFEAEAPCLTGSGEFSHSLARVLKQWGSEVPVSTALDVWTMIDPVPAVLELIHKLRANGTRVALATNQQSYRARYMLNELGYATKFDHVLCSCDLGYAKPSPEYFAKALEIINLSPENVLFIDDHHSNVEAARTFGLHARNYHVDDGASAMVQLLANYGLDTG